MYPKYARLPAHVAAKAVATRLPDHLNVIYAAAIVAAIENISAGK